MSTVLSAPGDTWGISGPTFLIGYAVLAGVSFWLAFAVRRGLNRGGERTADLDPFAVALLAGGPRQAVEAAIAGLRARKLIKARSGGISAGRQPGQGLHPIENAVHRAIAGGRSRLAPLLADDRVRAALEATRRPLERDGLTLSSSQRTAYRAASLILLPVFLLGLARYSAGMANHKPIFYLGLLVIVVAADMSYLFLRRTPRSTAAGRAVITDVRKRHDHLAPKLRPAWSTYGPGGAAMGVALFGTASLVAADPAFAAAAELQRQSTSSGSTDSGSSSSDSGSSCSGGSSCGSGGGCGG